MKTAEIAATLIDSCGSDLSVVNAARVSFDKVSSYEESRDGYSWELPTGDVKLISYLARHKHTSPFNHCFASFRVKAPIFVARQLVKHKFLPWNEVSRRYVDSEPEFFIPKGFRARAESIKQGSLPDIVPVIGSTLLVKPDVFCKESTQACLDTYNTMLRGGICPEMARMVLPQNTMTEWVWSGTLGAWADMCRLRLDPHSQYETQLVAQQISTLMKTLFPISWEALLE